MKLCSSRVNRAGGLLRIFCMLLTVLVVIGVFLPPTSITATEEDEPITVGWVTLPGLQSYEDGVFSGYSYDYLMRVAEYTGWTYEFVSNNDLNDALNKLESGKYDLIGGLMYNEDRAQRFDLSAEYGKSYISLFASQSSNLESYAYDQFEEITVGMIANASANHDAFLDFAVENEFTYTAVMYEDSASLSTAILASGMNDHIAKPIDLKTLLRRSASTSHALTNRGKA